MKKLLYTAGLFLIIVPFSFCGDLDDGIGMESGINAGNDLQKDLNVKFIIRKAKSAAQNSVADSDDAGGSDTVATDDSEGGANIGGVNMIGGRAGDIYIIQEIKGDITTINK